MAAPQDHTSDAANAAQGGAVHGAVVDATFPRANGAVGAGKSIESQGHDGAILHTRCTTATTPTVKLQGSNDKVGWNDLGTNAHAGNDHKFLEVAAKGYRFFRANKTVDGDVDYYLRLVGASGPF